MATLPLGGLTESTETQDLNFKVAPDFHRAFKLQAIHRGMSMREMLEKMATEWWKANPVK